MKLCNIGHTFDYETEKLIRIFFPFEKIEIVHSLCEDKNIVICKREITENKTKLSAKVDLEGKRSEFSTELPLSHGETFEKDCERELAVQLYYCLLKITNYTAPWGILTGVRPAKLFSRLTDKLGEKGAEDYFKNSLKVNADKISLCKETVKGEKEITSLSVDNSFSLYISVPFCPTRCSYCSFVSHSVESAKKLIPEYVELLCKEIEYTAKIAKNLNLRLETVYMGGGTPTTLSSEQLYKVLDTVNKNFDLSHIREYTVEAGRPDTITKEKLQAIKNCGVTRISINPQTLNDDVLKIIGRNHTAKQMVEAFNLARELGFSNINTDLIAGLPGDTVESFSKTLGKILELDPESVTVHSLSMKRASTLTSTGDFSGIEMGETASLMVDRARKELTQKGIVPYYMYRQSKTVGNLENVGYAKEGYEGLYNVYIMDETHTILGCGASAVTKLRQPRGSIINRIFNFKYPFEYINRFDEQLSRKDGIAKFYEKYFECDK